jgi:SAM-dependent methyltransferase
LARSKAGIVARHIYRNWRLRKRFKSGDHQAHSNLGYSGKPQEEVAYIQTVLTDYLTYAGLSAEVLRGKRILEIGPGYNLGLALRMLSLGAAQVVSIDKFYSLLDGEKQRKIYRTLREGLTDQEKELFDQAITLEEHHKINPDRLKYLYGQGIDEGTPIFDPHSFDLIISRAVLEEIYNLDAAFSAMDHLLVSGGIMIHKIDLRDYNMFSRYGMHPLTFLTIPERIYYWMTKDTINPKRRLINYYRDKMEDLGYEAKILITHIVGKQEELIPYKETIEVGVDYSQATLDLLDQIRPKLDNRFKNLSNDILMVTGIFLVAKRLDQKKRSK